MNRISVIIPVYNAEKYISRAIKSVLNQTMQDIEIILVDDESNDKSGIICDQYSQKYKNIKVIHKKNEGAGIARSEGLKLASGRFVTFLDSDDYIDSQMYEILYKKAIKEKAQACFCGNNKVINEEIIQDGNIEDAVFNRKLILERTIPYVLDGNKKNMEGAIAVWHGIYDLNLIRKNNLRFLSERYILSEDTIFNLEFFIQANKIAFVEKYLHYQCIIPKSLSRSENNFSLEAIKSFYNYIFKYIKKYKDLNQRECLQILRKRCLEQYKMKIFSQAINEKNRKIIYLNVEKLLNEELLKDIIKNKNSIMPILSKKDKIFIYACKNKIIMLLILKLVRLKNKI